MICILLKRDSDAVQALDQALLLHMPPALLAPLHQLKPHRPDFYIEYALPLLNRH